MPRTQSTVDFTFTNEAGTLELNFSVSYTVEPDEPGDWWNPPVTGGIVDVSFELMDVRTIRSKPYRTLALGQLGKRWVRQVERDMQRRHDADGLDAERVNDAIAEQEGDRGSY